MVTSCPRFVEVDSESAQNYMKNIKATIGGSGWGVLGTSVPSIQFLLFSCSVWQNACQITSFWLKPMGWRSPHLGNPWSATGYVKKRLLMSWEARLIFHLFVGLSPIFASSSTSAFAFLMSACFDSYVLDLVYVTMFWYCASAKRARVRYASSDVASSHPASSSNSTAWNIRLKCLKSLPSNS